MPRQISAYAQGYRDATEVVKQWYELERDEFRAAKTSELRYSTQLLRKLRDRLLANYKAMFPSRSKGA